MKRILFITAIMGAAGFANACDICSCSAGGSYFGILPQFQRHFAGIRYQYRSFQTNHPPLFATDQPMVSDEYFHTSEFWGRYVIGKRVQLFGFVPVHHFTKIENDRTTRVKGLGDLSFIANVILLNTADQAGKDWKHAFQVGGGVKIPTGETDRKSGDELLNPNLQPGTGSIDFPLNAVYTLRYKQLGINTELNYRFNTANRDGYQFGNRMSSALRLFYWIENKGFAFLPQAGISLEHAAADRLHHRQEPYTGGSAVLTNIGMDVYLRDFSFGLQIMQPTFQDMGDGQIEGRTRITVNCVYLF